jgi:hypothetical protein
VDFAAIDDDDRLHEHQDPRDWRQLYFGCGLFHFRKPARAQ